MRPQLVLLAVLLSSALVSAADPPVDVDEAPSPATEAREPEALRAWVDPETGELTSTPTPAQRAAFERALRRDLEQRALTRPAPRIFQLSGGGTGVYQEGGFLSSMVVMPGTDGTLHLGCRDHRHLLAVGDERSEGPNGPPAEGNGPREAPLR